MKCSAYTDAARFLACLLAEAIRGLRVEPAFLSDLLVSGPLELEAGREHAYNSVTVLSGGTLSVRGGATLRLRVVQRLRIEPCGAIDLSRRSDAARPASPGTAPDQPMPKRTAGVQGRGGHSKGATGGAADAAGGGAGAARPVRRGPPRLWRTPLSCAAARAAPCLPSLLPRCPSSTASNLSIGAEATLGSIFAAGTGADGAGASSPGRYAGQPGRDQGDGGTESDQAGVVARWNAPSSAPYGGFAPPPASAPTPVILFAAAAGGGGRRRRVGLHRRQRGRVPRGRIRRQRRRRLGLPLRPRARLASRRRGRGHSELLRPPAAVDRAEAEAEAAKMSPPCSVRLQLLAGVDGEAASSGSSESRMEKSRAAAAAAATATVSPRTTAWPYDSEHREQYGRVTRSCGREGAATGPGPLLRRRAGGACDKGAAAAVAAPGGGGRSEWWACGSGWPAGRDWTWMTMEDSDGPDYWDDSECWDDSDDPIFRNQMTRTHPSHCVTANLSILVAAQSTTCPSHGPHAANTPDNRSFGQIILDYPNRSIVDSMSI